MAGGHNIHEVTERLFEDREDAVHSDWWVTTFMKSQRGYCWCVDLITLFCSSGHHSFFLSKGNNIFEVRVYSRVSKPKNWLSGGVKG